MFNLIKKIIKKILNIQPQKIIEDNELEYLLWICNLYLKIKNLPGHIAEVGVADGRNTILFGLLIKLHSDTSIRQYLGFDTFDGFDEKSLARDLHLDENRWKNNSKEKVLRRCQQNGIEDLIEIFEGKASETVPMVLKNHKGKKFQRGKAKFALVYIDCNAYLPSIESMENFLPNIVPGGYIVIDEKLQGGETEAIFDFAKKHSLKVERLGANEVPMAIKIPG